MDSSVSFGKLVASSLISGVMIKQLIFQLVIVGTKVSKLFHSTKSIRIKLPIGNWFICKVKEKINDKCNKTLTIIL